MIPNSVYAFYACGALTLVLIAGGYAFHSGALSRLMAYLSISSATAAVAWMVDLGILLGPHGPSRLAEEMGQVERVIKRQRDGWRVIRKLPDTLEELTTRWR